MRFWGCFAHFVQLIGFICSRWSLRAFPWFQLLRLGYRHIDLLTMEIARPTGIPPSDGLGNWVCPCVGRYSGDRWESLDVPVGWDVSPLSFPLGSLGYNCYFTHRFDVVLFRTPGEDDVEAFA